MNNLLIPGPGETEEAFLARVALFELETIESNKGLLPWQGGCAWIEKNKVTLQLRQGKIWFYSKEEIIAHERVHALRMAFEEPRFEEILAYHTSPSRFRKYFGPLFRSSSESVVALVFTAACSIVNLLDIHPLLALIAPLGLSYFFFRLAYHQRKFTTTLSRLQQLGDGYRISLHLTDQEIILFAKLTPEKIVSYGKKQTCIRWERIRSLLHPHFR